MSNWSRKQEFLFSELHRYKVYAQVIQSNLTPNQSVEAESIITSSSSHRGSFSIDDETSKNGRLSLLAEQLLADNEYN